jgi:hypothetical protein
MLRFLTDELQDAEDAGDRGALYGYYSIPINLTSPSVDHRSRRQRLGR